VAQKKRTRQQQRQGGHQKKTTTGRAERQIKEGRLGFRKKLRRKVRKKRDEYQTLVRKKSEVAGTRLLAKERKGKQKITTHQKKSES